MRLEVGHTSPQYTAQLFINLTDSFRTARRTGATAMLHANVLSYTVDNNTTQALFLVPRSKRCTTESIYTHALKKGKINKQGMFATVNVSTIHYQPNPLFSDSLSSKYNISSHRSQSDSRRSSLTEGNLHIVKRLLLHQNMNIIRGCEKAWQVQTATCSISLGQGRGPVCAKG